METKQPEQANQNGVSRSDAVSGLAATASANAYAEIVREELRLASQATEQAHFGTAETHRKNAAMAFEFELKMRQQPNASNSAADYGGDK